MYELNLRSARTSAVRGLGAWMFFSVLLIASVVSAARGPGMLPRIEFPDSCISDIEMMSGHLYVTDSGSAKRLHILSVRSLSSADLDSRGAIRYEQTSGQFIGCYRPADPDAERDDDPSQRVVGALRVEPAGGLAFQSPPVRLAVVGAKIFVASSRTRADKKATPALFEVDASDKSAPQLVQSVSLPVGEVMDMVADARLVVVAGEDKVLVYQTTNLDSPKSTIEGLKEVGGLFLSGSSLYVGTEDGLTVYSVKGGEAKPLGKCPGPAAGPLVVEGRRSTQTAYVCHTRKGAGLTVMDASKPGEMKPLGGVGKRYQGTEKWLKSPADLRIISTSVKGYSAKQICVADQGLGLKLIDITKPQSPRLLGVHPVSRKADRKAPSRVCVDRSHAYVGMGSAVEIVRLTAGTHLDFAHEFVADLDKQGEYLYMVESEATKQLYILKIADSFTGTTEGAFAVPLSIGTYRLETPDDTDLEQPGDRMTGVAVCSRVGNLVLGVPLRRVRVVGDRAFIASSPSYQLAEGTKPDPTDLEETLPPKLFEVDVADKRSPRVVRSVELPLKAVADMTADGKHVVVAGDGMVLVYRRTDLSRPAWQIDVPKPVGLFCDDGKLFIGCGEGLRVYALGNGAPRLVGRRSSAAVGSVFVSERRAYLCHPEKGGAVEIVDVSDVAKIKELGQIGRNPKSVYYGIECPLDVEVRGNVACVADHCFGLKVFDVSDVAKPRYLGGHYKFSRWWKVVSFRVCTDEKHAYVGTRAAMEIVNLPSVR